MPILADDVEDRARQVLALTERLTVLIRAEQAEIERRDPPDAAMAEERARLANVYRQEMLQAAQDPQRFKGVSPAMKTRLQASTQAFLAALEAHADAVAALKDVSEGLVHAMAAELTRLRGGPSTYDAGGYRARSAAPVAVAVNRSA